MDFYSWLLGREGAGDANRQTGEKGQLILRHPLPPSPGVHLPPYLVGRDPSFVSSLLFSHVTAGGVQASSPGGEERDRGDRAEKPGCFLLHLVPPAAEARGMNRTAWPGSVHTLTVASVPLGCLPARSLWILQDLRASPEPTAGGG